MMYLMLLLLRKYIITCYQTCLFVMWYVCSCGDCLQGENDKYIILTKKNGCIYCGKVRQVSHHT